MKAVLMSMHKYLYKGYWNTAKEEANVAYEVFAWKPRMKQNKKKWRMKINTYATAGSGRQWKSLNKGSGKIILS